ncbi:MAG: hypothetical protein HY862_15590 [Chloroflexi bacterium]|nr:hypothetical protein [Chloroflexota bacterium]
MTSPILKEDAQTENTNQRPINPPIDNDVDVDVNVREAVGVIVLGVMFFIILMTLLRTQKRERKLLEEVADLRVKLQKSSSEAKS